MRYVALLFTLALAGCTLQVSPDENSPYYLVPVGSTFVLKQPIEIAPQRASVYVQYGRRYDSYNGVNLYHPHCVLEVERVLESSQRVAPGEFTIYKSAHIDQYHINSRQYRVAAFGFFSRKDGGSNIVFATHLWLRSATQPEVRRLICKQEGDPALGSHVTIREMRKALGEFGELRIATLPQR